MANKRIYSLTEQETYSADLVLAVDESSLTEAKKIKVSTVAPKIDTLTAASGVNVAQYIVRLNNGAGAETKSTIRAFFDLMIGKITSTLLYDEGGTLTMTIYAYRFDKLVTIMFRNNKSGVNFDQNIMYTSVSGSAGAQYFIPADFRPVNNTRVHGVPGIEIQTDGTVIAMLFSGIESDYFSHTYITA